MRPAIYVSQYFSNLALDKSTTSPVHAYPPLTTPTSQAGLHRRPQHVDIGIELVEASLLVLYHTRILPVALHQPCETAI